MIIIKPQVENRIKQVLLQNPGQCLRVEVEGDGCAGPYLRVYLDKPGDGEVVTEINGIRILLSDEVKRHAEITNINIFLNGEEAMT